MISIYSRFYDSNDFYFHVLSKFDFLPTFPKFNVKFHKNFFDLSPIVFSEFFSIFFLNFPPIFFGSLLNFNTWN